MSEYDRLKKQKEAILARQRADADKWRDLAEKLAEALELSAVRFTPALDGYCWCSRAGEPSAHKAHCLIGKDALTLAREMLPDGRSVSDETRRIGK